ncbi:MAG: PA0069 family radical SAM protein [Alphaproteobacteria bacterium]|nr:PA0069 family radical SAM protein [Alphaproteobacteria bacterium]
MSSSDKSKDLFDLLPDIPRKGRGAVSNKQGRYEVHQKYNVDDGWADLTQDAEELPSLCTKISVDQSKTILTKNNSPDIPFVQSINPYRGCEHGCIYCYARPTHAWLGLSPGLDFESHLWIKPEAPELLAKAFSKKNYKPIPITLGANTDPYQPIEKKYEITRNILKVLSDFNHPFALITKSSLVLRDLDLLQPMGNQGLVKVYLSITTLNAKLARLMEPRAATPNKRLKTVEELIKANVPTGVLMAPIIPGLNDIEIEDILSTVAKLGVQDVGYVLLRLPHEIKDLFQEWLQVHYPLKAKRILTLIRETRGGYLNDPNFGQRMVGTGVYAQMIAKRFKLAEKKFGLVTKRF